MDRIAKVKSSITLLLFVAVLYGCGSSGASIRYYMVDAVDYRSVPDGRNAELVIEIMDVHIPQYMERFNIVSRGNQNQLFFSENNQWGDNFRKNLLRTMAQNLSNLLGTNDVGTPINRTLSIPDYRIQIHLDQFERNYDGYVKLVARWQILDENDNREISTHYIQLISGSSYVMEDYENIVGSMKELYGELGQLIADSISER
jgi:uncharacterized lipoprotein YmbA